MPLRPLLLLVLLQHLYHLILIVGLYYVRDRKPFPHLSITMSPAMVLEGSCFPLTVSPTLVLEKTHVHLTLTLTMVPQEKPFPSCKGKINGALVSLDDEILVHSVEGQWIDLPENLAKSDQNAYVDFILYFCLSGFNL